MKKVLIISKYIAPVQAIASIRWTKLAKYLRRSGGYELSVLTDEKSFDGSGGNALRRDALLEKDISAFTQYHVFPDGKMIRRYYMLKEKYSDYAKEDGGTPEISKQKQALYELMHDWKDALQFHGAIGYLKSHPELLNQDVIISSCGPLWTHLTGEWFKQNHPRVCWIADYRDLFCTAATPAITRLYRHGFAKRHTAGANLVTAVSEEMIPQLELPESQPYLILPNGYDPEEALPPLPPERFTLLYTGKLYREGTRRSNLRPIFGVLRTMLAEGALAPGDLILQYAGHESGRFLEQAAECGLETYVDDHGFVSRGEAAALRQRAAGLLLCTWNTGREKGVLTGKLFEYMQSKKPIFAVCDGDVPNSRVREILAEGGLGCCCEICRPETLEELRHSLISAYRFWKETGAPYYRPRPGYAERFVHPVLAQKLSEALSGMEKERQACAVSQD